MDEIKNDKSIRIYGVIYKDIMRTKKLTGVSKLIYSYLISFSGGQDKVFPGLDLMADELGFSKKTIIKHRKQLEDIGLLTVEKVITKNGHKNIYYLKDIDFRNDNSNGKDDGKKIELVPPKKESQQIPYKKIIEHLNNKTGKKFSYKASGNQRLIKARYNEDYKYEDFIKVIDVKVDEWLNNSEMNMYLRPETLFKSSNFDKYLNQEFPQETKRRGKLDDLIGGNN